MAEQLSKTARWSLKKRRKRMLHPSAATCSPGVTTTGTTNGSKDCQPLLPTSGRGGSSRACLAAHAMSACPLAGPLLVEPLQVFGTCRPLMIPLRKRCLDPQAVSEAPPLRHTSRLSIQAETLQEVVGEQMPLRLAE